MGKLRFSSQTINIIVNSFHFIFVCIFRALCVSLNSNRNHRRHSNAAAAAAASICSPKRRERKQKKTRTYILQTKRRRVLEKESAAKYNAHNSHIIHSRINSRMPLFLFGSFACRRVFPVSLFSTHSLSLSVFRLEMYGFNIATTKKHHTQQPKELSVVCVLLYKQVAYSLYLIG